MMSMYLQGGAHTITFGFIPLFLLCLLHLKPIEEHLHRCILVDLTLKDGVSQRAVGAVVLTAVIILNLYWKLTG